MAVAVEEGQLPHLTKTAAQGSGPRTDPALGLESKSEHRRILEALSGLLMVLFVAMISSTIVSTALPRIIGALGGTQGQYTWVVTATLLAATVTTPIWGKLADLFPKKSLIQIAIVIFAIGSLACGFAQNTPQLIAFRAFQGIGVGGLQALVQVAIASMIPPRERGRYNGYLGGVMAVATVSGPLLGGVIVDTSWLGWRWCFFIGVPFALVSLLLLAKTLKLPHTKRETSIDYVGATLIAAGVSLLLIWVSFVRNSFDWISWQTGAMVGGAVLLLLIAVIVESKVKEPIIPLSVLRDRTTATSIVASLAVGTAMFGGSVFLGQYFQLGRGFTPTHAGLLTIPLMVGVLVSSTIAGQLITRTGKIKPFIVVGTVLLVAGLGLLATIDHTTSLVLVGSYMALVGIGVGMSMQNLVLAVQNTVAVRNLGAASSSVAFFRSLGGTIGVSVLGAVLANRVTASISSGLAAVGIHPSQGSLSSTLDIKDMPEPVRSIVMSSYGDSIARVFLIAAGIAVVSVLAAMVLPKITLRSSLDLPSESTGNTDDAANGAAVSPPAAPTGAATPTRTQVPAPELVAALTQDSPEPPSSTEHLAVTPDPAASPVPTSALAVAAAADPAAAEAIRQAGAELAARAAVPGGDDAAAAAGEPGVVTRVVDQSQPGGVSSVTVSTVSVSTVTVKTVTTTTGPAAAHDAAGGTSVAPEPATGMISADRLLAEFAADGEAALAGNPRRHGLRRD